MLASFQLAIFALPEVLRKRDSMTPKTWRPLLVGSLLCLSCGGVDDGTSRSMVTPREEPREVLASDPFVSACATLNRDETKPETEPRGLRDTDRLIGVALASHRLASAPYAAVAAREFNYVTPENEMKWGIIEPSPGVFDFQHADLIVSFADQHDMLVKGHTLVWHSQLPGWVSSLVGAANVRAAMELHISTVVSHYRDEFPGSVIAWDVVNEALDSVDGSVSFRDSVFYRELGEGFIAEAFELARAADPEALLFYNDYGIEGLGAKSNATFELVQDLLNRGVPIDGIGFQMHTTASGAGVGPDDFEKNLERYSDIGLLVNISEMDVSLCSGFASEAVALEAQRVRYNQMVGTCLRFEACHAVSLWGVSDGDSWLNSSRPCESTTLSPWPLVFDYMYRHKPAWGGVADALAGCRDAW
jgi:endo-1,4-beta-xylanase